MKDLYELNSILEEKNEAIDSLESKVESLEKQLQLSHYAWMRSEPIPVDDFRQHLPVPRLEMILRTLPDGYGSEWVYGIVRKAHPAFRSEWKSKELVFMPISRTTTSGGVSFKRDGKLDRPFRDDTHFQYDLISLNLPGYLTCPELQSFELYDISEAVANQFNED